MLDVTWLPGGLKIVWDFVIAVFALAFLLMPFVVLALFSRFRKLHMEFELLRSHFDAFVSHTGAIRLSQSMGKAPAPPLRAASAPSNHSQAAGRRTKEEAGSPNGMPWHERFQEGTSHHAPLTPDERYPLGGRAAYNMPPERSEWPERVEPRINWPAK